MYLGRLHFFQNVVLIVIPYHLSVIAMFHSGTIRSDTYISITKLLYLQIFGLNNYFIHRKYIHVSTINNGTGSEESKVLICRAREIVGFAGSGPIFES